MIQKFQNFLTNVLASTKTLNAKKVANICEAADAFYSEINPPLYHPGDAMYILVIYSPAGNTSTTGIWRVFIKEVTETINALDVDQTALRYAKDAAGPFANNIITAIHLSEAAYNEHWFKRNRLPDVMK